MIEVSSSQESAIVKAESALEASKLLSNFLQVLGIESGARREENLVWLAPSDLLLVWHLIEQRDYSSSPQIQSLISDAVTQRERHGSARQQFYKRLEVRDTSLLSDYWLKTLFDYQAIASNALVTPGLLGGCLFDEQGTGKTVISLSVLESLFSCGEVQKAVVVAPKTLIRNGWLPEIRKFWPSPNISIVEVEGTKQQRLSKYREQHDFYLLTYDAAYRDLISLKSLMASAKVGLVVDESYFVKNSQSLRGAALEGISNAAAFRLILCGTPAPNSPADIVHQFNLSDLGYTFGHWTQSELKEPDQEKISSAISERGVMLRRLKSDVLESLPPKKIAINWFDLNVHQRQLYDEAKTEFLLYLKNLSQETFTRDLVTYFQRRAALLQICISPNLIGDPLVDSAKYEAVLNRVQELFVENPDRKLLVWSAYTKSTDHLMHILKTYSPARIDGTMNSDNRRESLLRFQNDSNSKIMIGNPSAAGAGLNLVEADVALYVSHSNQAAPFMQSIDRIHRIGQKAEVVKYEFFAARGTIENTEISTLLAKQLRQSELLRDKEDSLDLNKVILELETE
jgi:SNF2 family DNA or RNA helicase